MIKINFFSYKWNDHICVTLIWNFLQYNDTFIRNESNKLYWKYAEYIDNDRIIEWWIKLREFLNKIESIRYAHYQNFAPRYTNDADKRGLAPISRTSTMRRIVISHQKNNARK